MEPATPYIVISVPWEPGKVCTEFLCLGTTIALHRQCGSGRVCVHCVSDVWLWPCMSIQAQIDLYKKSRIKQWVSIANTHTCEKSSPTVLMITGGGGRGRDIASSEGAEACGECEVAFVVMRPFVICLGNAWTLLCFFVWLWVSFSSCCVCLSWTSSAIKRSGSCRCKVADKVGAQDGFRMESWHCHRCFARSCGQEQSERALPLLT